MVIDARTLTEPIVCTLEDIETIQLSQRTTDKAAAQLRALAERNTTDRQRAVSALVRMTGNARAIRVNDEKNNNNGGR